MGNVGYNYFKTYNLDNDQRKVLIRIIVPSDDSSRDRIIKATNSQTVVQQASLRATDKIHRDIEEYLRPKGLFYDRRKNYYKNEGKPRNKIIGISHLAQAVMAIVLQQPNTARARPSSLLKKDEDYAMVFNSSYPIQLYYVCAEATRRVEQHLKDPAAGLEVKDRNNLRFYVAMHAVNAVSGTLRAEIIAEMDMAKLDRTAVQHSLDFVMNKYSELGGDDQVAKGPALLEAVLAPA